MRKFLFIIYLSLFPLLAMSQEIKGTVVDENSTPLIGVTVTQ